MKLLNYLILTAVILICGCSFINPNASKLDSIANQVNQIDYNIKNYLM